VHASSLGVAAQINIIGELWLVFAGLWFAFLQLPSEKYKIIFYILCYKI
jgi:hypothetical protein